MVGEPSECLHVWTASSAISENVRSIPPQDRDVKQEPKHQLFFFTPLLSVDQVFQSCVRVFKAASGGRRFIRASDDLSPPSSSREARGWAAATCRWERPALLLPQRDRGGSQQASQASLAAGLLPHRPPTTSSSLSIFSPPTQVCFPSTLNGTWC